MPRDANFRDEWATITEEDGRDRLLELLRRKGGVLHFRDGRLDRISVQDDGAIRSLEVEVVLRV